MEWFLPRCRLAANRRPQRCLADSLGAWWSGLVMSFAVMPWLNPTMYAGTVRKEPGWWFVLHLIYGGTLVVTPSVVRSVSAHRPAAEVTESWRAA